ncbi:hypothetical protein ABGY98_002830 [Salmonella enterica]|nr:hypothetical protein [Salmonella enterica]ECJ5893011.1 hypothetical protein [Salmonella enterica subsp. diarizonae]ECS3896955.1 hypothetical protein [Salmonella enterica subsp. diarizonae serovar 48:i:z]EAM6403916.1 hypothetical protein [Salmonella enterica]EAN2414916.1 hypothetical protein [Salmonella enterica]
MLITLEILFCTDLRRSLLTVGNVTIENMPTMECAITEFTERNATTPPGAWVRQYKGRNWLTRSVPAQPFRRFLEEWHTVPGVARFLSETTGYTRACGVIPGTVVSVWIGWPDDPDPVAVGASPPDDGCIALVA